ncbi:hypothetical protein ACOME3_006743 [Neoechinorhynchus agilis]
MQRMPMNADAPIGVQGGHFIRLTKDQRLPAGNVMQAAAQGGYCGSATNPQSQSQETPHEYYGQMKRMPMNADVPIDVQGGYFTRVLNHRRIPMNAELPTDVQGGYFTPVLNPSGKETADSSFEYPYSPKIHEETLDPKMDRRPSAFGFTKDERNDTGSRFNFESVDEQLGYRD